MRNRLLALIILPIVITLSCVNLDSEKIPLQFEKVDVYPGAIRDTKGEAYIRSENSGKVHAQIIKVYRTNAAIEDVCKFYLKKFGFNTGQVYVCTAIPYKTTEGVKPYVGCMMNFYEFDDLEDQIGSKEVEKYKAALAKVRKPYQQDKWLSYVSFIWGPTNTRYTLEIKDYGAFKNKNQYKSQTAICITCLHTDMK